MLRLGDTRLMPYDRLPPIYCLLSRALCLPGDDGPRRRAAPPSGVGSGGLHGVVAPVRTRSDHLLGFGKLLCAGQLLLWVPRRDVRRLAPLYAARHGGRRTLRKASGSASLAACAADGRVDGRGWRKSLDAANDRLVDNGLSSPRTMRSCCACRTCSSCFTLFITFGRLPTYTGVVCRHVVEKVKHIIHEIYDFFVVGAGGADRGGLQPFRRPYRVRWA